MQKGSAGKMLTAKTRMISETYLKYASVLTFLSVHLPQHTSQESFLMYKLYKLRGM